MGVSKHDVEMIVPTAIGTKAPQIIVLSSLYCFMALLALYQGLSAYRFSRQRGLKTGVFRVKFLGLAFVTMFVRFILITFPLPFWDWSLFWLFFLDILFPQWLIFVTFSLIILFLAKISYIISHREHLVHRELFPKYFAVITCLFLLDIGYAIFLSSGSSDPSPENYDKLASLYSVVVFILFVIGAAFYGWKITKTMQGISFFAERREKVRTFKFLLYFYLCLFFMRWCWDLTHVLDANPVQKHESQNIRSHISDYYTFFLFFYFITELFPTGVLILSLHLLLPHDNSSEQSSQLAESQPILRKMDEAITN